jgi:superfamily II DNA/RNA helicase
MTESKPKTVSEMGLSPSFDLMGLKEVLLKSIYRYGFEKPSAIQQRAIVPMISGRDFIGSAQSGTGKTATFTIATLQQINYEDPYCEAIIVSPTKELAEQTFKVVKALGSYTNTKGEEVTIKTVLAIGGKDSPKQNLKAITEGAKIMVGTPGRILHLLNDMPSICKNIKVLVIDEADVMLDRGFKNDLYAILTDNPETGKPNLPDEMQVALFSATLPDEALAIAEKFMTSPIIVTIKKEEVSLSGISQYYIPVEKEENKFDTLQDILSSLALSKCIVFCNSKNKANWLTTELKKLDVPVGLIHSDLTQPERDEIMSNFRSASINLLVATEIIARGIDVKGVSHVINYDVPTNRDNYIHRIGRTGRYGSKGVSITFITATDGKYIEEIETYYKISIKVMPLVDDLNKEV